MGARKVRRRGALGFLGAFVPPAYPFAVFFRSGPWSAPEWTGAGTGPDADLGPQGHGSEEGDEPIPDWAEPWIDLGGEG